MWIAHTTEVWMLQRGTKRFNGSLSIVDQHRLDDFQTMRLPYALGMNSQGQRWRCRLDLLHGDAGTVASVDGGASVSDCGVDAGNPCNDPCHPHNYRFYLFYGPTGGPELQTLAGNLLRLESIRDDVQWILDMVAAADDPKYRTPPAADVSLHVAERNVIDPVPTRDSLYRYANRGFDPFDRSACDAGP